MASTPAGLLGETSSLDTLPDDAVSCIFLHVRRQAVELRDALRFFRASKRLLALVPLVVDELELSLHREHRMLRIPFTHGITTNMHAASLLAPYGWAARLTGLRALEIVQPSWSGAARLLTLLPAWPVLEQLELRFLYEKESFHAIKDRFQELADDLAAVLRHGALPRLRYLWLGHADCQHCFGQRWDDGTGRELSDRNLLEELKPTAALWWLAERAEHVRSSKLNQWQYEIDHGADLQATVGGFDVIRWMWARLGHQRHSRAGHAAVYDLLVSAGVPIHHCDGPFTVHNRAVAAGGGTAGDEEADAEGWATDYTTDEECSIEEAAAGAASEGEGEGEAASEASGDEESVEGEASISDEECSRDDNLETGTDYADYLSDNDLIDPCLDDDHPEAIALQRTLQRLALERFRDDNLETGTDYADYQSDNDLIDPCLA